MSTLAFVMGCGGLAGDGSGSAPGLACELDADCLGHVGASGCVSGGYCVNEAGARTSAETFSGPGVGSALDAARCNPLNDLEVSRSRSEPLGAARSASGTVYGMSRAGSTYVAWRTLRNRLVPYRVFAQNFELGGGIFGVDDGGDGFALSMTPAFEPTTFRLFDELEDAAPTGGPGSGTTRGRQLEVIGRSAFAAFDVASELSPAQVVSLSGTSEGGALMLVRSGPGSADTELRVFYGDGRLLLQRRVIQARTLEGNAGVDVQFWVDGARASALVRGSGVTGSGSLQLGGNELSLWGASRTPLALSKLGFRCALPMAQDWAAPPRSFAPPSEGSCGERPSLFFCVDSPAGDAPSDGALDFELAEARVAEMGSGLPPTQAGDRCRRRPANPWGFGGVPPFWARLEHEAGETWLTIASADIERELPFGVGDLLALESRDGGHREGAPPRSQVTLRSTAGGLLLWMGIADALPQLSPPEEFELTPGSEECATSLPCIQGYSQYALDSRRIGGEAGSIRPSEQLLQGGFRVLHAGLDAQTGATSCSTPPIALARAALWRAAE